MEIFSKIVAAFLFGIAVIIISALMVIAALTIELKLLVSKRKRLQLHLTKEEQRLLELSSLITNSMVSINAYISEISRKRQELLDKKCHCTQILANNTENRIL